jgi:SPP1 family phage portal protein
MEIASETLREIIDAHLPIKTKTQRLYQSYMGQGLPIEEKKTAKSSKINNIIKSSYRSIIIDQICGYVFGRPITFAVDSTKYEDTAHELYNTELQNFLIRTSFDDVSAEVGKLVSTCGHAFFLPYINKEGQEMVMCVPPWEAITLNDKKYELPQVGIRYYPVIRKDSKGKESELLKVEVYDESVVHFYIEDGKGFTLDNKEPVNPLPHSFSYIPLIKVVNNTEEQGDFEKVESLIDAYDRLLSSEMDEIEQFANAYLLITGYELDEETLEEIKRTGAFSGMESTDRIEFITKQINDQFIENVKSTLNENVYKFSASVDMSDEKFSGGGESGESRKWKLIALDNRAITLQRKFSKGLRDLFKVICSSLNKKGIGLNYLDVWYTFNKNLPVDTLYVAEVGAKLAGIVSQETQLSTMSGIVDDVEYELTLLEREKGQNLSLDSIVVPTTTTEEEDELNGGTQ